MHVRADRSRLRSHRLLAELVEASVRELALRAIEHLPHAQPTAAHLEELDAAELEQTARLVRRVRVHLDHGTVGSDPLDRDDPLTVVGDELLAHATRLEVRITAPPGLLKRDAAVVTELKRGVDRVAQGLQIFTSERGKNASRPSGDLRIQRSLGGEVALIHLGEGTVEIVNIERHATGVLAVLVDLDESEQLDRPPIRRRDGCPVEPEPFATNRDGLTGNRRPGAAREQQLSSCGRSGGPMPETTDVMPRRRSSETTSGRNKAAYSSHDPARMYFQVRRPTRIALFSRASGAGSAPIRS